MLTLQSNLMLKDNSKMTLVKMINMYKKKNLKLNNQFLGVIKESSNTSLKKGKLMNFLITHTKKKFSSFSGKLKSSDLNCCISLKESNLLDPGYSSFLGFFFSEMKNNKNQKLKNMLNQCI